MSWVRLDDGLDEHAKTDALYEQASNEPITEAPDELRALAAVGLLALTLANCGRRGTDGFVNGRTLRRLAPVHGAELGSLLREAGFYDDAEGGSQIHDFLDYNPSAAQIEVERAWDRKRKELFRDPDLIAAIRKRDKDRCRYCAIKVDWKDRRSPKGATYDHVQPRGDNTLENVVVACRGCNTGKGGRTPDEAGMPLLKPGAMSRSSSNLDRSQNGSSSDLPTRPVPDPGPEPPAVASNEATAKDQKTRADAHNDNGVVQLQPKAARSRDERRSDGAAALEQLMGEDSAA